jgi:hypothetical protein
VKGPQFIFSLDVGQAADYTAGSGLQRVPVPTGRTRTSYVGTSEVQEVEYEDHFRLGYLRRWPLHTPYPVMASDAREVLGKIPGTSQLTMDATGVGRPVVDYCRDMHPVGVIITGGSSVEQDRDTGFWKVPKRVLISNMQVYMQDGRLKISSKLPLVDVFVKEALNFKMRINAQGNYSFEAWREGVHDDLILSVAIGLWWGHRTRTGWMTVVGPMNDFDRMMRAEARERFGFTDEEG